MNNLDLLIGYEITGVRAVRAGTGEAEQIKVNLRRGAYEGYIVITANNLCVNGFVGDKDCGHSIIDIEPNDIGVEHER